jgi:serine/threonine protein kinase
MCREVLTWRQLLHPNILPLIGISDEVFDKEEMPCIISEWMEQGTLKQYTSTLGSDDAARGRLVRRQVDFHLARTNSLARSS